MYKAVLAGKPTYVFGDPDMPHAYSYMPDIARALARLGTSETALGRAWHLPVAWSGTTRALLERFARRAGTHTLVRAIPDWALRTAGMFLPLARALAEMSYQWHVPYRPDDTAFRQAFGFGATPIDEAIDATLSAANAQGTHQLPTSSPST